MGGKVKKFESEKVEKPMAVTTSNFFTFSLFPF
jgi:hypothetical protein